MNVLDSGSDGEGQRDGGGNVGGDAATWEDAMDIGGEVGEVGEIGGMGVGDAGEGSSGAGGGGEGEGKGKGAAGDVVEKADKGGGEDGGEEESEEEGEISG